MNKARILTATLVVLAISAATAWADGMIVPVRPDLRVRGTWAVKYHHVKMMVRDQVASVSIEQEFYNTSNRAIEVEYMFPVPPGAAIDSMTMMVDGKEFTGKLLPADEARKIYEDIVRKKKDPALLEYVGFGLYRTSAFPLEPNKPVKVIVTYNHVCKKDRDLVEVFYPLNTEKFSAKEIDEVSVTVDIKTQADITAVYSPSHDLKTERKGPRHMIATYQVKNAIPNTDFVVFYRARDEQVGATLLTYQPDSNKDGYFLLLASPNPKTAPQAIQPKDIVLVIDHSGSMSANNKIGQAKDALSFILKNLNPEDRFKVIMFNDSVEGFFDNLTECNRENIDRALDMVDRIEARGGTNIHKALERAMQTLTASPRNRPKYAIFLTDGLPTVGITDESKIVSSATRDNTNDARLFALGVGYDVNVRLLDRLVAANHGLSDYVKPGEPLEAKISNMYAKVKNPVMTDIKIALQGVKIKHSYPQVMPDLFDGSQLLLVGRYDASDVSRLPSHSSVRQTTLVVTGKYQGSQHAFEYPVSINPDRQASVYSFVERLWATRRVGYLLDQIQLHGKSDEVIDEIVQLSRDYGIITPYTSFLADESTNLGDRKELRAKSASASISLGSEIRGGAGQTHAMNRQAYNQAERGAPASTAVPVDRTGRRLKGPSLSGFGYRGLKEYEAGETDTYTSVQNVGNQTLYRRGRTWMTPENAKLDRVRDKAKIRVVQRYSDEYFELVRANTVTENQILANQAPEEELLVTFRSQVYLIQ